MLLQMQHIPLGGDAVAQRSGDKALEQGMCTVGAALELRVELCAQMEVAAGQFYGLTRWPSGLVPEMTSPASCISCRKSLLNSYRWRWRSQISLSP